MSDSDDENYVTFGSPLDPLDEENIPRKKPVTIADQYAYDSEGRRRFHGAFTGGFSAGYFNSVGSQEGWKPQQFKSSRSSKMDNIVQRPEDFMDDEDVGQFGIAPTGIRATKDYVEQRGTKRERIIQDSNQPIPGTPVLQELLRPMKETVGIVLLRKMGWKPGQGIGSRVTKAQKAKMRQQNTKLKVYGCAPEGASQEFEQTVESNPENSDDDTDITFAPDDYEPFRCNPKDNYFGIGYSGLSRQSVLSSHINLFDAPTFSIHDKNKKLSIRGQAFGVGAFEADDDDIYEREDMSRYDFTLETEREKKSRWSKNDVEHADTYLENFVHSKNKLEQKTVPLPQLPADFLPVHTVRKSRFYPSIEYDPKSKRTAVISAKDRSRIMEDTCDNKILKNEPIITREITPDTSCSVTKLLEGGKIKEIENKSVSESRPTVSWLEKLQKQRFSKGGIIEPTSSAEGNLSDKSQDSKVNSNANFETSTVESSKDKEEIKEDVIKIAYNVSSEMRDAAKMKMFGKLTRTINNWQPTSIVYKRFNIPEQKVEFTDTELRKTSKPSIFDSIEKRGPRTFLKESNTVQAESSNDYKFIETINLETKDNETCYDDQPVQKSEKEREFEISYEKIFGKGIQEKHANKNLNETSTQFSQIEEDNKTDTTESMKSKDKSQEKKDLFKTIFLSSSDSETEEEDTIDSTAITSVLIGKDPTEINVQRNTSPPRGIFAKVDLDSLVAPVKNDAKSKVSIEPKEKSKCDESTSIDLSQSTENDTNPNKPETLDFSETYGPALPARLLRNERLEEPEANSSESSRPVFKSVVIPKINEKKVVGEWVEARSPKKVKKEKKKKHKNHKSTKHKHKKKRSH